MPLTDLTRRTALGVGAALAIPTSTHVAEAKALPTRIKDWSEEDRVRVLMKQQARLDEGKVIWRTRGVIYGFKAPESPIPLVRFKGCEQQWIKPVSSTNFVKYTSLLTYYCDAETDEIIDSFTNPMTGEDVTFRPNWSRVPEGQTVSNKGVTINIIDDAFPDFYADSSINDIAMSLIGDTVSFHAKMRWPEPMVRRPYNQDNAFFAKLSDLQDESLSLTPSHGAGQILMPSMGNIGMTDPKMGQVIWHVEFYKVRSWDDLPEDYLTKALAEHGEDFDVSPENDTEPSRLARNLARLGYLKN